MAQKSSGGLFNYPQTIKIISGLISKFKEGHRNNIILIAIEGLSCTGKSTFAKDVKISLKKMGHNVHIIEGDLFHRGLDKTIPAYQLLIKKLSKGYSKPIDLFPVLWDMKKFETCLINPLMSFNKKSKLRETLIFPQVFNDKRSGTSHEERLTIDRTFIILLPAVFIRHLPGIDVTIELRVDKKRALERKISRARLKKVKIKEDFIKDTFLKLEVPWFLSVSSKCQRKPDIIISTNNPSKYKVTQVRPFPQS